MNLIGRNVDLALKGHLHTNEVYEEIPHSDDRIRYVVAPSLFGVKKINHREERRKPELEKENRRFGYFIGRAIIKGNETNLTTWERKLVESPHGWRFEHPEGSGYNETEGRSWNPIKR